MPSALDRMLMGLRRLEAQLSELVDRLEDMLEDIADVFDEADDE